MHPTRLVIPVFSTLALLAAISNAQAPAFDPAKMRAEMEAYHRQPDTAGSGPYAAIKETVASLPDHVLYRPSRLEALGTHKLGIVAWGNGGCAADGAGARFHLAEIASHGYLAIASGSIQSGPGAPPQPEAPAPELGPNGMPLHLPPPATSAELLRKAIDWALAENARRGSAYYQRIDPRWIAVSGWSCGGLQALEIAADPRVATAIIHSSGIFADGNPIPGITLKKDALKRLHTPILYVLGGPTDIAYANGMDDYSRIDTVPAVVANLDVGHGGTFLAANGGREAVVAVAWLDWVLKGDAQAGRMFQGPDCGLCKNPDWKIEAKHLETVRPHG